MLYKLNKLIFEGFADEDTTGTTWSEGRSWHLHLQRHGLNVFLYDAKDDTRAKG